MPMLGTNELDWDKEAWEFATHFAFDAENFYDNWATVQPGESSTPGSTVHFTFTDRLDPVTAPLNEYDDVDAETTSSQYLTLTVDEYGNAVETTKFNREHAFIPLNPTVAEIIGHNAGRSLDELAKDKIHSGMNVARPGGTSRANLTSSDQLTANLVRRGVGRLRTNNVPGFNGAFVASIHPDVSVNFREATGADAWREPQIYGQTQERIFMGEVGIFEGVRFIEHSRANVREDAGDGTDVYDTLFIAQQALAKGFAPDVGPTPMVMQGPITDTFKRFVRLGWYWLGGYRIFRQESLHRIETGSDVDSSGHSTYKDDTDGTH